MAEEKTKQFFVAHPKLFLQVEGKLTHQPKGAAVQLTQEQAEKLGSKIVGSMKELVHGVQPEKEETKDKAKS